MFKKTISLFLVVILTSCNSLLATPTITPAEVMETAQAIVKTEIVGTLTAMPTNTPVPSASPLPPTETSIPIIQSSSIPFSGTPTVVVLENGLEWTECVVPSRAYVHNQADMEFLAKCFDIPTWDENDKRRMGERVEAEHALTELRITIGSDHFETKLEDISQGCCRYELIKNGEPVLNITPGFVTSDPNRNFWNIGGKLVWELAGYISVIVVDGVNFNEKYQLEGSHFPYEIDGKLIYIAKKNGKYHIVYNEKVMGPEFDQIFMAYCCGMISVYYGQGQYWFVGRRDGTYYVVAIH